MRNRALDAVDTVGGSDRNLVGAAKAFNIAYKRWCKRRGIPVESWKDDISEEATIAIAKRKRKATEE